MQLRNFQRRGADFLTARRSALLLDDAGLGKSATTLHAADALNLQRILIIGPAIAAVSWPQQIALWSPHRQFTRLGAGHRDFSAPGIYFVSADLIGRKTNRGAVDALRTAPRWDLIVLDEAQLFKNSHAWRTVAVYGAGACGHGGISANADRVWLLSGTIMPNHAGELFPHCRALLSPGIFGPAFGGRAPDRIEFEDRFCTVYDHPKFGRRITGSSSKAPELRSALAPYVLRRQKRDVLAELPPLEFHTAPIDLAAGPADAELRAVMAETGISPNSPTLEQDIEHPCFATARHNLGVLKIRACAEWIADRFISGESKIVVFAHHTAVINGLFGALEKYGPVALIGATPQCQRTAAVDRFQTDPSCRLFLGNIIAAGTAITLTAASTVFFAEYSGTPGQNYQAASRCHRMGQRDGVQAYFATVPGTIDGALAGLAARRARDIAAMQD